MTSDPLSGSPASEEVKRRTRNCREWYRVRLRLHETFATVLDQEHAQIVKQTGLKTMPIQTRVKTLESFLGKALRRSRSYPKRLTYEDLCNEIQDVVGARNTLHMVGDTSPVEGTLKRYVACEEQEVHGVGNARIQGFPGKHYLVSFTPERVSLTVFRAYAGLETELQVRTVLQHTWAEMQHDLIYKPRIDVPVDILRRLVGLAEILEVADQEFEAVTSRRYVEELEQPVHGQDNVRGGDVRDIVHTDAKVYGLPAADEDWLLALQDVVDSLGLGGGAVHRVLGLAELRQRAVAGVLEREDTVPNAVQIANALLPWELGGDYVRRHPLTKQLDAKRLEPLLADVRRRVSEFEAELGKPS